MLNYYILCATLAALAILFPQDAMLFPRWLELKIKLHYVNGQTFLQAWLLYRRLKKDFAAQGWPAPPFKYKHIWERELP